jgi:hypothetical protein
VTVKLAITLVLTVVVATVLVPRLAIAAGAAVDPAFGGFGINERIPLALAPAL